MSAIGSITIKGKGKFTLDENAGWIGADVNFCKVLDTLFPPSDTPYLPYGVEALQLAAAATNAVLETNVNNLDNLADESTGQQIIY